VRISSTILREIMIVERGDKLHGKNGLQNHIL